MSETDSAGLGPTAAFELLGDETRFDILRVLADAHDESDGRAGLPFAELRRRVGVRDAGRFNYHLDRLRGHFVEHVDDEYRLRYAGFKVVSAVLAGTYTDRGSPRSTETDHTCPECSAAITATYEDELLRMECPDHDVLFQTALPPGAAEGRSMADLVDLANRRTQQFVERAVDGVCPMCWGPMAVDLPYETGHSDRLVVGYDCRRCWMQFTAPVAATVVRHPAVVALYHDHGVDVRDEVFLDLGFLRGDDAAVLAADDPTRVEVSVAVGDDEVVLTLDEGTNVVAVDRA